MRLTKSSSIAEERCLYLKLGNKKRVCIKEKSKTIFLNSPSVIKLENEAKYDAQKVIIDVQTEEPNPCSSPEPIRNGYVVLNSSSLFSIGKVSCLSNYFLMGSHELQCQLDYFDGSQWKASQLPVCVQLCSDQWEIIHVTENQISIPIPLFFKRNFTEHQICKWKITSKDFSPMISLSSSYNVKKYVKVSIVSEISSLTGTEMEGDTSSTQDNHTETIYICPKESCQIIITPLQSLSQLQENLNAEIVIKLADNILPIQYHPILFVLVILLTISCFIVFAAFYDYSHHPYSGYTARFIGVFKSSKLKTLVSYSNLDHNLSRLISRTEADIIVYYQNHHSTSESVSIKRSASCGKINDDELGGWRMKFQTLQRRFSDITDMVFKGCAPICPNSQISSNQPTDVDISTDTGNENKAFEII